MKSTSETGLASYGLNRGVGHADARQEELAVNGYTVLKAILSRDEVRDFCTRLDTIYECQVEEFGAKDLDLIQERDLVRAPLLYDDAFLHLAANDQILDVVHRVLNQPAVLHLQNAIISRSGQQHHQAAWHRDLPYQNFTISTPLSISVLVALEDFSIETGATQVIPASHLSAVVPSDEFLERHARSLECEAGSAVLFDSMLLHRAGMNVSGHTRRAINNVYVAPILRQQIDFAQAFGDRFSGDDRLGTLLGYRFQTPASALEWRRRRLQRVKAGNR